MSGEICVVAPSRSPVSPYSVEVPNPERPDFRMRLITPAIASEPYCAEAPSLSTSTRSMALAGMRSRSAGDWPFCVVPLMNITAVLCRRLPLTNTSTWSLDSPRIEAVLIAKLAPAPLLEALTDGTKVAIRPRTDCLPLLVRSSAESTSIGARLSATVRVVWRVPVTINSWRSEPSGSAPRRAQSRVIVTTQQPNRLM